MAVRFLPAYPTLLLFLLTVLTLGCRAAAQCAFSEDDCIDPLAQTAVSLSFQPLFTQNITFYYGFDAQGPDDPEQQALPENERMPIVKASFWLRYAHTYLDSGDVRENRTSEIALRVGNLTGSPSGGNNGCDGVWGSPCSEQIRQWLKRSMFELSITGSYFVDPLDTILGQTKVPPPELLSCPPTLFDVQYIPVETFAQENEYDDCIELEDSGSSDSPWRVWYIDHVSAAEQAEQVAVGIISRGPTYGSAPLRSEDDVQVELVCVRAPRENP